MKKFFEEETGTSDGAKKAWDTRRGNADRTAKRQQNLAKSNAGAVAFAKKSGSAKKGWDTRGQQKISADQSQLSKALSGARVQARKDKAQKFKQSEDNKKALDFFAVECFYKKD